MTLENTVNGGDTKPTHHHQQHHQVNNLCSRCSRACRLSRLVRCWSWWKPGCALLCGAMLLSALTPGAPLAHRLLSRDAERQRLLGEKEARWQRSQTFLQQYRASQGGNRTRDPAPRADVGVAVLTMSRERRLHQKVGYRTESLTESVATLLQLRNDTTLRKTYSFLLCNVDEKPELFQEAAALEDILPVRKRFQAPPDNNVSPSSAQKTTRWEKLKMDYVYCLRETLAQGVQYALIVEDDAIAHRDLFPVLERVLEEVVEAPGARPVAYLKLYHPLRLLGYISLEVERLPELLALALTLGAILTCVRGGGCQNVLHNDPQGVSRREVWVTWAGWSVVVAVVALSLGRPNLLELRRLSGQLYQVTPTPSCCTPAILYTRQGALDLAEFLLSVECTEARSTDMRMDEFRQRRWENRGLLVQPNLFSHVGMVSGLHGAEVNPLIVQ